jgi:hypothetical protein
MQRDELLMLFLGLDYWERNLFPTILVTKVKPNINSVELHPQVHNNGHPVDGALVGAGSE